jgi:Flp pilus assembly pilin Flp
MEEFIKLIRLPRMKRHSALIRFAHRAIRDERGGEVIEYALVVSLIVMGAIGVIGCVGTKVFNRWNSVNQSV